MIKGDKYMMNNMNNNNSPTKLNSINHKVVINTGKVEVMNCAKYNTNCYGKVRWDEDGDGAGVGEDGDDDLDDARDKADDDEDDLPLWEEFSPAESARQKGLFFSGGFHPRSGSGTSDLSFPPQFLGHRDYIHRRGSREAGPTS